MENKVGLFHIQVEPQLRIGDIPLEQETITCQTVLSKSLGPFDRWWSSLEVTYRSGYSMVHLTPIQQLNETSNSSYSVKNHHLVNPMFGTDFGQLKSFFGQLREQWKLLSITDLVYNHVATDCQLLQDHPECSYNLINSPHLKPAVLLDSILIEFSRDLSNDVFLDRGFGSKLEEHHLQVSLATVAICVDRSIFAFS